jgi:NAD(P)-dependent dehydrogenase (short-subunit alcohol dehydrogenase family)
VVVNDLGVALDGSGSDRRPADTVAAEIRAQVAKLPPAMIRWPLPRRARYYPDRLDAFGRLDILVNNAGILGLLKWIWRSRMKNSTA